MADPDYRTQIIERLARKITSERSYILRTDFPDLWYDLYNTTTDSASPAVSFTTVRSDFSPQLGDLKLTQVVLYLVGSNQDPGEIELDHLHLTPQGWAATDPPLGGPAQTTTDGIVSTRRTNGMSWLNLQGQSPMVCGIWLSAPNCSASWTMALSQTSSSSFPHRRNAAWP